jgi:transcriptional regulator GlxA family with amidase domain
LSAVCAGTFVLAESGLLNQRRATATWWLAPMFRERNPQILLDESDMVVKSGKFVTAGAALGHIDLALWLMRGSPVQFSPSSKSFYGMEPMRKSAKLPIMVSQ